MLIFSPFLMTQYCPLRTARCDLWAVIFVTLKILRMLLFAAIVELENDRCLAPVKTEQLQRRAREA